MKNSITKLCANKKCSRRFNSKNPKKKYCDSHCKNQAAYNYRLSNYAWEVELSKARLKNIQILEYLFINDKTSVNYALLKTMGFAYEAAYLPYKSKENKEVYRYGNLGLIINEPHDYIIIEIE